jgi:hypothetical protein
MVEHLPSKCKALSSNPRTTKILLTMMTKAKMLKVWLFHGLCPELQRWTQS